MSIYDASATLRRVLNDCAYEFGVDLQDRCTGIRTSVDYDTINVDVDMYVVDRSNKYAIQDDIESTIRSICSQYDLSYRINMTIHFEYEY